MRCCVCNLKDPTGIYRLCSSRKCKKEKQDHVICEDCAILCTLNEDGYGHEPLTQCQRCEQEEDAHLCSVCMFQCKKCKDWMCEDHFRRRGICDLCDPPEDC
jgi:hypothetical protein